MCQQVASILLHLLKAFRRCHYLQVPRVCNTSYLFGLTCHMSRACFVWRFTCLVICLVCAQAEYLARLVCDSNYLLLALKYLNQDCDKLLRLPDSVSSHASACSH